MTRGLFDSIHEKWIMDAYSNKFAFHLYNLLNTEEHMELYKKLYRSDADAQRPCRSGKAEVELRDFPFRGIQPLTAEADIAFANLECPLSNCKRILGQFSANPVYAKGLRDAGFGIVSIANNHIFDVGEEGFNETLLHLERAGICYTGGGSSLAAARQPVINEVKGYRIGFLAYTQVSDNGFNFDVASEDSFGILPFSMPMILEDISNSRSTVDILIVSLHWLSANTSFLHRKAVDCAHQIINAGADIIVGHHSHVVKAIEIYKGKPILYSLGNLIFGLNHIDWWHNLIAKVTVHGGKIQELEVIPISGVGDQLFQPEPLMGKEARKVFDHLAHISAPFGTKIHLMNDRGVISV
jgi:poly-gamma-glutamate synthesis protein (capsule biosynthesis protein)